MLGTIQRTALTIALSLGVFGAAILAHASAIGFNSVSATPTHVFQESACPGGDAGPLATPCVVSGGPYDGFSGTVGAEFLTDFTPINPDTSDVFSFNWLTTAPFIAQFTQILFPLQLSLTTTRRTH
jgi:hypothetical protein